MSDTWSRNGQNYMVPNSENYSAGNLLIKHRPITTEEILAENDRAYTGPAVFIAANQHSQKHKSRAVIALLLMRHVLL